MGIDLPLIWAVIIVFGVMMYVVMDGFDLGVGILFPFVSERRERDTMINTIAPVWDGNETWLVLGGAALFAAFPLAYGFLLSALYLPVMLMLGGLIWRGVSFEFRFKAAESRRDLWDRAFAIGSYAATFGQGIAIGAFINGFNLNGTSFVGGPLDCITPFSVFTGVGLMFAYALLGSTWLIMRTEGGVQIRMRRFARVISVAFLVVIVIVSIWTPILHANVSSRWFTFPNYILFAPVPILVIIGSVLQIHILGKQEVHAGPFLISLALIFLGYSGLAISLWPDIIPPGISIWEAAGPPESLGFTLVGTLFIVPIILVYTSWSYYVFRGKSQSGEGYE